MDPSGFIEPVIAIIEPTARSTSRVGYIPSTSSIFGKLEDSSSSSIILKCSSMLSNSSILLSSFLFVLQFSCPPLQVPSAFLKSEKPDSWACQQQSSAAAQNFLSSHRTYCWPLLPGPYLSHSIWAADPSEGGVTLIVGIWGGFLCGTD